MQAAGQDAFHVMIVGEQGVAGEKGATVVEAAMAKADGAQDTVRMGVITAPAATAPRRVIRPVLEGQLQHVGLPTILLVLEMERKSGVLRVVSAPAVAADLTLRKGRVVRALLRGSAPHAQTGAAAVYAALAWTHGTFELYPVEIDGPDEIQTSTTFLLMEAARRQDEATQAKKPPPGKATL